MRPASKLESSLERGLFAARWLMAPMYLGLVLALVVLMLVFTRDVVVYLPGLLSKPGEQTILAVLTLIDLTLVGNLLLIVIFSGYENFVSKIDLTDAKDRPAWMGMVDFTALKMKLIASIVAISGIHLLKKFMELGESPLDPNFDPTQLRWLVITHLTFVVAGVLLAVMDWIAERIRRD